MTITRTPEQWRTLATRALVSAGAGAASAAAVADALVAAELDGLPSHGLMRLPFYADQVLSGKVDGKAIPDVQRPAEAVFRVDARNGFAFPAITAGLTAAVPVSLKTGVVAVAVGNSHHCGVLGHHVEWLAQRGLIGLAFANTPAAIAPWGTGRGLFGTNPIALASPRRQGAPLVVDLSMSVVARGKVAKAAESGEEIPAGWALDASGRPTTDPRAALKGTMMAIGGPKGAVLALVVELLAAALTCSHFGFEASSFFEPQGPPPRVGQLFLVFHPAAFGGAAVIDRVEALCGAVVSEPGGRLPGERRMISRARLAESGIAVPEKLFQQLQARAGQD